MSERANMSNGGNARSSEDIDDVLSSIRRLVSDHPSKHASMAPPDRTEAEAEATEGGTAARLVLTQEHRVADLDDPWTPVTPPEPDAPEAAPVADTAAEAEAAEDTLAAEAETSQAEATEDEPDQRERLYDWADTAAFNGMSLGVPPRNDTPPLQQDPNASATPEAERSIQRDPGAPAETPTEAMGSDPVQTAEASGADAPEAKAETWPDLDTTPSPGHGAADHADKHADDLPGATPSARSEPATMADAAPHLSGAEAFRRPRNAGRPAFADFDPTDNETPPDTLTTSGPDEPADPVSDMDGATIMDEPAPDALEIDDFGEDTSPFSFPDPSERRDAAGYDDSIEALLDEETLREIIVDVVREELQGLLGQRITRNVRKMVRREVRLALSVEDLE